MDFEILGPLRRVETIDVGASIPEVWYEATGVGRRELKIKRLLAPPR